MRKVIFLILMTFPVLLFSQTEFESYNWDTFPAVQNSDTIKCVNGAAVTLERRIFEIYLNAENYFEEMFVYHRKIKIDSHNALSNFNKIYVSLENVIDIVNIQARFIAPNGKITILPKESIKQIANLDNDGDYKTFAIEGAEVGGQIEYFYVLRKKFDANSGYFLQDRVPKSNVEILFAYPSKISYLIKGYNGVPAFKLNTENPEKTYQKSTISYIPSVEEEKYANYKASLLRFEYTLSYNRYQSALRKFSWKTGCENTYNNVYDLSKDDKAAAHSLYKQIVPAKGDVEQKVRAIENWIKLNFSIKKEIPYQKDLSEVIRLKQANNTSAVKLFVAILLSGNINFEFVATGNNTTQPFDPDFNCINFLNHYLIYFPETDNYLIPDDIEYRLGLIPPEYQGEYGLFMRQVSYNEKLNALAYDIRQISIQDHSFNTDSLQIALSLNTNQIDIEAKIHRSITGALAKVFQNIFQNLTEDKKKEVAEQFFRMGKQDSKISSLSIKNDHPNNIGLNPIILDVTMQAGELIENAGNDLLFHIGETIGRQSELYQEQSRKLPIHVGILHSYYRKIEFQIPSGYMVANPENLEMNVAMKNGDNVSCIFTSQAEIKGDRLIIVSREYYNDESYPASRYNEFRDVINAAADFNKKTILLKKI
jgi:hypothetical protein